MTENQGRQKRIKYKNNIRKTTEEIIFAGGKHMRSKRIIALMMAFAVISGTGGEEGEDLKEDENPEEGGTPRESETREKPSARGIPLPIRN